MIQTIHFALIADYPYVRVMFNNGTIRRVSMKNFIEKSDNPLITQYKDKAKFKKDFSFDRYGLYWGNDLSVTSDWAFRNSEPIQ